MYSTHSIQQFKVTQGMMKINRDICYDFGINDWFGGQMPSFSGDDKPA
jgi:hypothetical protein